MYAGCSLGDHARDVESCGLLGGNSKLDGVNGLVVLALRGSLWLYLLTSVDWHIELVMRSMRDGTVASWHGRVASGRTRLLTSTSTRPLLQMRTSSE